MNQAGAAENDPARDIDEVRRRHEIADGIEDRGYGFARKKVAGKENARNKGEESKVHGHGMGTGLAGDENAARKRYTQIRPREKSQQKNVAVNGHAENATH